VTAHSFQGQTNCEIKDALGKTPATVKNQFAANLR